jgi:3-hydroxy-3-methylglutaryl CoA synthase
MYKQDNISKETIATMGSVISDATDLFEEVLQRIENHEDKKQRKNYLMKFIRTLKQKQKKKGKSKRKLVILLLKAKALFFKK